MDKDYSIYKYYKGSDEYPNDKARFFGFYEQHFDVGYIGKRKHPVNPVLI